MFSAAAAHLDRTAAIYDGVAVRYQRAADQGTGHRAQLVLARDVVQWNSQAGDAFRAVLDLLVSDSTAVQEEAAALAGEATAIAGVLREWAQVGRSLAAVLEAITGADVAGVAGEALLRRARAAVEDVTSLVSFIQDYGGLPAGLREAVSEVLHSD